jgi:hypothetical protein
MEDMGATNWSAIRPSRLQAALAVAALSLLLVLAFAVRAVAAPVSLGRAHLDTPLSAPATPALGMAPL